MASEQKRAEDGHQKEKAASKSSPEASPSRSRLGLEMFKVPSPLPTKRTRTTSQSRIASESPEQTGTCRTFCRDKGHGFITPDEPGKDIFVHISDIEGEYVLKEGDRVVYRTCPLPPKNTEKQAVEVIITEMHGPHKKWWSNTTSNS